MDKNRTIPRQHPEFHDGDKYFMMSGTSQAAAVVSGIAALMLQKRPDADPGRREVRPHGDGGRGVERERRLRTACSSREPASCGPTTPCTAASARCANNGLDIAKDLAGTQHYAGPAAQDADR